MRAPIRGGHKLIFWLAYSGKLAGQTTALAVLLALPCCGRAASRYMPPVAVHGLHRPGVWPTRQVEGGQTPTAPRVVSTT